MINARAKSFCSSLVVATILAATGTPAVAFEDPVDLSAAGKEAVDPEVAIDNAGDSLTIWRRDGAELRVQARYRNFAGTLSGVQNISGADVDAFNAHVAMDSDGDAVIVWTRQVGAKSWIQARERTSGGTLGPILNLSSKDELSSGPVVRMTPNGRTLVVWVHTKDGKKQIKARFRAANGSWGGIEEITTFYVDTIDTAIAAALNENAKAVIVWGNGTRIRGRTRAANGVLGGVKDFSPSGGQPFRPVVAMSQQADALVVWDQVVGTVRIIRSRFLSSTGTLDPIQDLSPEDDKGASQAQLVMQRDGDAVIAWNGLNSSSQLDVRARVRKLFGQLGPVLLPSDPNTRGLDARVAAGEANLAVILWRRPNVFSDYFYEARVLKIGDGKFKPTVLLSEEGEPDFGKNSEDGYVAMNASGSARVVWTREDDSGGMVVQQTAGP